MLATGSIPFPTDITTDRLDLAGGRQIIFPGCGSSHTHTSTAHIHCTCAYCRVLRGGAVARSPVGCMAGPWAAPVRAVRGADCGQRAVVLLLRFRPAVKKRKRKCQKIPMPCSTRHQTSRESSHLRESRLAALRRRRTSLRDGTSRTRSLITPVGAAKSAPGQIRSPTPSTAIGHLTCARRPTRVTRVSSHGDTD